MGWIKKKIKNLIHGSFNSLMQSLLDANNEALIRKMSRLLTISNLHQQTFLQFKGCNKGKDVVIVGAGPTVSRFKVIDNAVYIGLNRACTLENIPFSYLFSIDKMGIEHMYSQFGEYDCVKFIGDQNLGVNWQIPETEIAKMKGEIHRYKTDMGIYTESRFALDIESEPIGNFNTVSLQAIQFALYTLPRRIFLVGIDCSAFGHFGARNDEELLHSQQMENRGENRSQNANDSIRYWQMLKDFVDLYYPETEIVSVNPVGLRGLFKDFDQ